MDDAARMKEAIKWMWSLGDYREVAAFLQPHAEALVDACAIAAGMEVLDADSEREDAPELCGFCCS
jgi:hypothetical protein